MSAVRLLLFVSLGLSACQRPAATALPLPQTTITDARYRNLVFLVATVRRNGTGFVVTNDSTQPWFDITLVLVASSGGNEFRLHLDEIDAGQSLTAAASQFTGQDGQAFDERRVVPSTLIVSAEIGEGGPTGVYAVRL